MSMVLVVFVMLVLGCLVVFWAIAWLFLVFCKLVEIKFLMKRNEQLQKQLNQMEQNQ